MNLTTQNTSEDMFENISYKMHEEHMNKVTESIDLDEFKETCFNSQYLSSWIVNIFNKPLEPLLKAFPNSKWLTVGDGRYGSDAHYLLRNGLDAVATDISDATLKIAEEKGFIKAYSKENAEKLSFKDKEFDFTLCKEALHHFPRPMIAVYEMIRVSRKGIVLVEPCDQYIFSTWQQVIFRNLIEWLSKLSFLKNKVGEVKRHTYESSGNYVYKISRREIEKVALGLNLKYIAFKNVNYMDAKAAPKEKLKGSATLKKAKRVIAMLNLLCSLKLSQPASMCSVIFIEEPGEDCKKLMIEDGFDFIKLPENPYAHQPE